MGSRIFVGVGAVDLLALGRCAFVGFGVGRLLRDGAAWIVDCSHRVIGHGGIGTFGSALVNPAWGYLRHVNLSALAAFFSIIWQGV